MDKTAMPDAPISPRVSSAGTRDREALEKWWSELPCPERNQALRLAAGVPLPEEFAVGLLLSGFILPPRPPGRSPVEQPRALREFLDTENSRRGAGPRTPAHPAGDAPGARSWSGGVGLVRRVLGFTRLVGPRRWNV